MAKKPRFKHAKFTKREMADLVIFLLFLYILIPQLGKFRQSLKLLKHLNFGWVDLSVLLALATILAATCVYLLLAKKRLKFWRTFVIELASFFTNRLLPAGIGSLGINFEYLRRSKHSRGEAGAVVAMSSLVGFAGHIVLLATVLITTKTSLSQFVHLGNIKPRDFLVALGILIVFSLAFMWFKKIRHNIFKVVIDTLRNIRGYRTHPGRLLGAVLCSMALTFLYTASLLACALALNVHLTLAQALIVLTVGVAGGTITPTPGGLLGAEAGLFAGLLIYKVDSAVALAIVLIYRLITYWLAMLIGALALLWAEAANYI